MAKQSIADKVFSKVSKVAAESASKAKAKRDSLLAATKKACEGLNLEYLESGKTLHIVYGGTTEEEEADNSALLAAAMHEGHMGYVPLSAADFKEWAVAITAIIDEQN